MGLATATWSGMRAIAALQGAMDEVWNVPRHDRPSFLRTRLEALVIFLALGIATVVVGLLTGMGASRTWVDLPLRVLAVAGTLAVNVALFAAVLRLLTEADVAWRDVLPGAVVGAAAWMALLVTGGLIVDRQIRNSTEIYGFFAVVIGLLAWLTIAANVVLLSAELNVVLKQRLWPRSVLPGPETTEPDRRVLAAEATEEAARSDEAVEVRFR